MKAALIACVVVGLLFTLVQSMEEPIKCGCNATLTNCPPCNPICGKKPEILACSAICTDKYIYCKCDPDYCIPTPTSNYCVPIKKTKPEM